MAAVEIRPLTADSWADAAPLFGDRGLYSGCWCMWWRLAAKTWEENGNAGNRDAFLALLDEGRTPGLVAYQDGQPVGWCSVAPRDEYPRLQRSPHTKPVDDVPAWAVVCFYVDRRARGQGVARALLQAAVEHAAAAGAPAVEGVPIDPAVRPAGAADAYTGTVALFESVGFREVARRTPTSRVVMRWEPGR